MEPHTDLGFPNCFDHRSQSRPRPNSNCQHWSGPAVSFEWAKQLMGWSLMNDVGDLHFNINSDVRILRQNVRTWTSSHEQICAYQLWHKSDLSFPSFQTQTTSAVSNLTLEVQKTQEEKLWNVWLPSSGQPQLINIPKLCHVMSCHASSGLSTFTIWEPECWQCAGKQNEKGESLESAGVGNLDKRFSYSQGCSHNLEWKCMKFDANHLEGLEVSMTGYFKCLQYFCRPTPPQIHDFFQGLNWTDTFNVWNWPKCFSPRTWVNSYNSHQV